jgi:hypothetical protein
MESVIFPNVRKFVRFVEFDGLELSSQETIGVDSVFNARCVKEAFKDYFVCFHVWSRLVGWRCPTMKPNYIQ